RAGIGLDAGEAIQVGADYRGGAINLAARLCSIAGPGEVFASEAVIHLAQRTEGLVFVDRGAVTLKGLEQPVRVIQIVPEGLEPKEVTPLQPILVTHPTNLPDEPTPFIGRAGAIRAIGVLLGQPGIRLVTLTGPGGTGKTRLAVQVGTTLLHDFPDGVFFVSLAPLADPSLVPATIAEVLAVKEQAGTTVGETLTAFLGPKHLLLVLDNLEHLLAAVPFLAGLLEVCRDLHLLVTSRVPLHLSREREYPVPPLALPDPRHRPTLEEFSQYEAVAFFIDRARAVKPEFAVTNENAPAVAEICARLDGLPLAIELAASRSKLFPPQTLLHRLSSRLNLLTGGARDRPSRQQTLRGAIDWSYSLLSDEEQTLFARLSVFAAGCTFEAAEAVCNPEGELDLLEELASLVDKSLVKQVGEEETRFGMLETIREFAGGKLEERGERDRISEAHARYFLALVEEVQPELTGPRQKEVLARLDSELDNLRAAMRWFLERGESEAELRLAAGLYRFWLSRGYWSEGRRWLEDGLDRSPAVRSAIRAKAHQVIGELARFEGDYDRATRHLDDALALSTELGDEGARARALMALGGVHSSRGKSDRAAALLEESLALHRKLGDERGVAVALGSLGLEADRQGDGETAKKRLKEALALHRERGDTAAVAHTLNNLGVSTTHLGALEEASGYLEESLELCQALSDQRIACNVLDSLGDLALRRGEYERATEYFRRALMVNRELGNRRKTMVLLGNVARLAAARGMMERAVQLGGAQAKLGAALRASLEPSVHAVLESVLDRAREALGEDAFQRAWERGAALSQEEVSDLALRQLAAQSETGVEAPAERSPSIASSAVRGTILEGTMYSSGPPTGPSPSRTGTPSEARGLA
ncbi:MAG: tetratricopeptide repeat protein, partial [Chloroflexota bacterium]|nr:tetratricopeptide repeat protein [Chloroflexota bacterium]